MLKIREIKIEEAKRKDINSVIKLSKEMADFHRQIDDYYQSGREIDNKKWILKKFGKRNFKILIAKKGNKIIGYGISEIRKPKSYIVPQKIGDLMNLYVEEVYREKGVGRKIFEQFLQWFKKRNIKNIELSVDARNEKAIKAYKKYGFFEFHKKMRLDL